MARVKSPLIDVDELVTLLGLDPMGFPITGSIPVVGTPTVRPDVLESTLPVVLDVRYPGPGSVVDGHAQYVVAHIPGAAYVSMDDALAAPHIPGKTGRHPMPDPAVFEEAMRACGVSADRPVIVYDDWFSIAAARAWWLLGWAGHTDVRVLDGGWKAWRDRGLPVATGRYTPKRGNFTVDPGHRRLVDAQGAARIAREGLLVDARPQNRHRGEDENVDPVAGHIPGSQSLPAFSLVDEAGILLDADDLIELFDEVGALRAGDVGFYCGSGIQASHAILAAEASGALSDPALYVGSWSDWITDPRRPVECG